MTDPIPSLIERLKAAEGPSRELDGDIATGLGLYVLERRGKDRKDWYYPTSDRDGGRRDIDGYGYSSLPRYTKSIDATIALVERKLPKLWWEVSPHVATIYDDSRGRFIEKKDGATPSITLLVAFLTALQEQEEGR